MLYSLRSFFQNHRLTGVLAAGLFVLAAFFGLGSTSAHADRWEVFDQGEHLFFPEGPVEVNGVVMVPLRSIAERFGYTFESVNNQEIVLKSAEGHRVVIRLGTKTALFEVDGGTKTQLTAQIPRNYNGAWFIDLALAGAMGGQGHSVVPGTNLIQLRPVTGDAKEKLESQYWFSFNDKSDMISVDNQGQVRLKASYTAAGEFGYDELLPVKKSGYTAGFMNRSGELAIDATYYQLGQFSEGVAWFKDLVKTESGGITVKMGFINRAGKVIVPAIYNRVYDFADGLAKVVAGGKTFYIDHNGKTVISTVTGLQNSESFSSGLAAVSVRTTSGGKSVVRSGFIDTTGKWAIKPIYDWASTFSEGVATATLNGKSGLIDTQGNWIVKPQYSGGSGFSGQFHDGYIVLTLRGEHDDTQRLVDAKGNIIAIPGIEHFSSYSDGMISYNTSEGVGFTNLAGQVIVQPDYAYVWDFIAGAGKGFKVINNEYSVYLINKAGEVVLSMVE